MAECVESACLVVQFMNEFIRPIRLQLDIYKNESKTNGYWPSLSLVYLEQLIRWNGIYITMRGIKREREKKSMIRRNPNHKSTIEMKISPTPRERLTRRGLFRRRKKIIKFTTSLLQATNMYYINCFTVRNESRIVPEALLTAASWMRRGDYREPCNHHHHHLARLHSEITKNKLWF